MVDQWFNIDLLQSNVLLNIPPFLGGREQLDPKEVVETGRIASVRIHVERSIERINNFQMSILPASVCPIGHQVLFICCFLMVLLEPVCLVIVFDWMILAYLSNAYFFFIKLCVWNLWKLKGEKWKIKLSHIGGPMNLHCWLLATISICAVGLLHLVLFLTWLFSVNHFLFLCVSW